MQWHEIACVGDLSHNNTKPTKTLDIPSIKGFRSLLLHGHGTHIATVPTAYRHADVSEVLSLRWSCPRMPAEAVVSRTMSHGLLVRFGHKRPKQGSCFGAPVLCASGLFHETSVAGRNAHEGSGEAPSLHHEWFIVLLRIDVHLIAGSCVSQVFYGCALYCHMQTRISLVEPRSQHGGTCEGARRGLLVPAHFNLRMVIETNAGGRTILSGSGEAPSPARHWVQYNDYLDYLSE